MTTATALPQIQLSPSAHRELRRLTRYRADHLIQLTLVPGECAQFVYSITVTSKHGMTSPDDSCWCFLQFEQLLIAVKTSHIELLDGLSVGYSEDLMGGSFRFENPNASQLCSCGNSFDA